MLLLCSPITTYTSGAYISETLFEIVPAAAHMNPLVWGDDAAEFEPGRLHNIDGLRVTQDQNLYSNTYDTLS